MTGTMAHGVPMQHGVDEGNGVSCDEGNDENANDGERVDGKDTQSQGACVDDSVEIDAHPSEEVAVLEHDVPDAVSACTDGNDGENDDGED